jgi:hypothetical protein
MNIRTKHLDDQESLNNIRMNIWYSFQNDTVYSDKRTQDNLTYCVSNIPQACETTSLSWTSRAVTMACKSRRRT